MFGLIGDSRNVHSQHLSWRSVLMDYSLSCSALQVWDINISLPTIPCVRRLLSVHRLLCSCTKQSSCFRWFTLGAVWCQQSSDCWNINLFFIYIFILSRYHLSLLYIPSLGLFVLWCWPSADSETTVETLQRSVSLASNTLSRHRADDGYSPSLL